MNTIKPNVNMIFGYLEKISCICYIQQQKNALTQKNLIITERMEFACRKIQGD